MEWNMPIRELYCPHCKIYTRSSLVTPKCSACKHDLITVVYSQIDGRRLTGNESIQLPFFRMKNELATGTS